MKKNKKALSLVIAIGITLVMSVLALYILEYIMPFSKNTKNIENSVVAYYQADSGIEDALYSNSNNFLDTNKRIDYSIDIESEGTILPPVGKGNSEFDSDFNKIRIGEPIQIEIGNNSIESTAFKVYFRVPDINGDGSNTERLSGGNLKIINWKISAENNILNSEDSEITSDQVNGSDIILYNKIGRDLHDNILNFKDFYDDNCRGTSSGCILKMSVINELKLNDLNNTYVPFLEWRIDAGVTHPIPLRYKIVKTTGKASGFRKNMEVKIPQQTLNQALDFTLFQ